MRGRQIMAGDQECGIELDWVFRNLLVHIYGKCGSL
jgi:hypothetical protein